MRTSFADLVAMDLKAVRHSIDLVEKASVRDLPRPTPCAAWTLGDLLAHMTAQHRGFAAAAGGAGHDPAHWAVRPLGADAVADYRRAAEGVLTAFAVVDGDREFALPEITAGRTFPAATAIGFHLVDYLVHSWDVAAALGITFAAEPELIDGALPIALAVPDGELRLDPDAAFGPAVAVADDADPLDRVLATLGRMPDWRFPAGSTHDPDRLS